jgi:hypothetical protein
MPPVDFAAATLAAVNKAKSQGLITDSEKDIALVGRLTDGTISEQDLELARQLHARSKPWAFGMLGGAHEAVAKELFDAVEAQLKSQPSEVTALASIQDRRR